MNNEFFKTPENSYAYGDTGNSGYCEHEKFLVYSGFQSVNNQPLTSHKCLACGRTKTWIRYAKNSNKYKK